MLKLSSFASAMLAIMFVYKADFYSNPVKINTSTFKTWLEVTETSEFFLFSVSAHNVLNILLLISHFEFVLVKLQLQHDIYFLAKHF